MNYYTADFHLFHDKIVEYCKRPFRNIEHMHKVLITNYNSVVEENDDVYIIGDLTLKGTENKGQIELLVNRLGGKKHFILGNHDRLRPFDYIEMGFWSVHTSLYLPIQQFCLNHDPVCIYPEGSWVLCGHAHNLFRTIKNVVNVGCDMWNYFPVSEIELINFIDKERINSGEKNLC